MAPEDTPWGRLTMQEVYDSIPPGTLPGALRTWAELRPAISRLPQVLQAHIREVAIAKEDGVLQRRRAAARLRQSNRRRLIRSAQQAAQGNDDVEEDKPFRVSLGEGEFLKLPDSTEVQRCISNFRQATGNEALKRSVCVVCARRLPRGFNPAHLQRGMAGNVTLYEVNTDAVVGMLEGNLLPQPAETLSHIIAITFIGTRRLPTNWMTRTFRVRRSAVHEALQWLQANNELYSDVVISADRLGTLPEDHIPAELMALIRHVDDESVATQEREGYVDDSTEETGETSYTRFKLPLTSLASRIGSRYPGV